MFSTLIGTKLCNDDKKKENRKLITGNKIKLMFWNNQKVDKVEEDKASIILKKKKKDKDDTSINSTQKNTQLTN